MQNWEYKVISIKRIMKGSFIVTGAMEWDPKIDLEKELKHMGENGWELVSVVPIADYLAGESGYTGELRYVFKRPK